MYKRQGGTKLSAEDGFLQFMIERLLSGDPPSEEIPDEDEEETGDSMKLTSIQSLSLIHILGDSSGADRGVHCDQCAGGL